MGRTTNELGTEKNITESHFFVQVKWNIWVTYMGQVDSPKSDGK
jgi:hypothetical protein